MIKKMLENARNIAIVGLSPDENKDSNKVARYLISKNYKIFPIYPKENEILGFKVYRNLSEIMEKIDIVVMFRKAEFADELIDEVIAKKVPNFWLQLGIINENAHQKAVQNGINFVQNKCIMIEHKNI